MDWYNHYNYLTTSTAWEVTKDGKGDSGKARDIIEALGPA